MHPPVRARRLLHPRRGDLPVPRLARRPYCRWVANHAPARDLEQAHLANALFDAHRYDPELGYRLLGDDARRGQVLQGQRRDLEEN